MVKLKRVMNKRNYFKALCAFLLAAAACSRVEEPSQPVLADAKVFYAELPSDGDGTKTYMDGDWNMYWYAGDLLSVFQSPVNEKYRFAGNTGEIINEFHKDDASVPGAAYPRNYAVYPYDDTVTCSPEGTVTTVLPSVQRYSPDSFGQDANTMVALTESSSDDVFRFRNVCGYLRLKIYGGDIIRRITLRGNNGEKIAGAATITAAYDAEPSVVMEESATTEITLDCGEEGVETGYDSEHCTSFWLVVPPVTFTKGFTLDITTANGITGSQSTDKSITISRNKVKQMAAFEWGTPSAPALTDFSISDGIHTYKAYDISNGYVNIMVPNQSDLSSMTATFAYKGKYVTADGTQQTSGKNTHNFGDFSKPVIYVVWSASGLVNSYKIRIFDLPVLIIDTPGHIEITSKKEWIEGSTIKMRNTDDSEISLGLTSIRGRGNSTWAYYPKKPYALKLDSKKSFFGLPKHKRWCLLANWMDKTLVRNAVSYEIARNCSGLAWTPDGDFVEVILNGTHIGNYYLCEQIKVDKKRVNVSEENGYLLTVDTQWDEAFKFKSSIYNLPYMFKDPDEVTDIQFNFIQSYVKEMEMSLYDDAKFAARDYLNYLDVPSAIDHWFVQELAMNHEPNGPKSIYMYKDGDGVMFTGPVWDFDWGTYLPDNVNVWRIKEKSLYYPRLFQDPEFQREVWKRWNEHKSVFIGIQNYIDSITAQIKSSESRDRVIWPFTSSTNGEKGLTYDQAVARMRKAYLDKLAWMDKQIEEMKYISGSGGNDDYDGQNDGTGDFNFGF